MYLISSICRLLKKVRTKFSAYLLIWFSTKINITSLNDDDMCTYIRTQKLFNKILKSFTKILIKIVQVGDKQISFITLLQNENKKKYFNVISQALRRLSKVISKY